MEGNKSFLVVMSVPGIDEYVYGTDRLVEIRGASGLLDLLNRVQTAAFLEKRLQGGKVDCIFAGGGEAQFIIESRSQELCNALHDLKAYFISESQGGLRLFCGAAELEGNKYQAALHGAIAELQRDEQEAPFDPSSSLHCGYVRECDSCSGILYRTQDFFEDERILCKTCREKVKHGRKRRLWDEMVDYLLKSQKNVHPAFSDAPKNFEEIGELCKTRKGYTALVYADGNRMSSLVRKIESKEQFRSFSNMMDLSIREACYEAILATCPPTKPNGSSAEKIPCDILLLGGDDLLLYMSADRAFPFVIDVARRFYDKSREKFGNDPFFTRFLRGQGLTLSFGIAYGKSHTPFSIMFRQSKELLKSAKKGGGLDPSAGAHFIPSYVDYHLTSYFSQLKVDECRKTHLRLPGRGTKDILLYRKPYSIEDADYLLQAARSLVGSEIPRSRIKRLGDIPSLGMVQGTLEFLKLYTRTPEKSRHFIWDPLAKFHCAGDIIPWSADSTFTFYEEGSPRKTTVWRTVLLDLIELTEFVSREKR